MEKSSKYGRLVLTRHGESEWNAAGRWTGSADIPLTSKGEQGADNIGKALQDVRFDYAFASAQTRSLETLTRILAASGQPKTPFRQTPAFNERDYGDYTGLNKWQLQKTISEADFNGLRRGWDYPIPNGETLKDVYNRTVPFYQQEVVPLLREGKTILLTIHGNSGRSLIKYIESIGDDEIADFEFVFGQILFYTINDSGKMVDKTERAIDT